MVARRRPAWGYVLIISGSLLFVLNAATSRALQGAGLDSGTMTSARLTLTAVVLLAFVLLRGGRLTLPRGWREWAVVLGFAVAGLTLVQFFYLIAISRLPLGLALLIEFTAPLLVALFARLVYREQVRPRLWVALVLSLAGLALVARVWDGLTFDAIGLLAAAGAAGSLATYFLVGEHSITDDSPLHIVTEAFIVAALLFNLFCPIWRLADTDLLAPASLLGNLGHLHLPVWVLLAAFIVIGTAMPFVLEVSAMQHLTATEVSLTGTLEPVGVTLLGWAWFDERLSPLQIVGVVVVLLGIVLAQTARLSPPRPEPTEPPLLT